jgi:hypothetical protein
VAQLAHRNFGQFHQNLGELGVGLAAKEQYRTSKAPSRQWFGSLLLSFHIDSCFIKKHKYVLQMYEDST